MRLNVSIVALFSAGLFAGCSSPYKGSHHGSKGSPGHDARILAGDVGTPSAPKESDFPGGGKKGAICVLNSKEGNADYAFKWSPGGDPESSGHCTGDIHPGLIGKVTVKFTKPPKHNKPTSKKVTVKKDTLHTITVNWKAQ